MLTQSYECPIYSLEYPRIWEMEIHDNIPAFFDPFSGKGALQILALDSEEIKKNMEQQSQYPYMTGQNLTDKMMVFLHMQEINYNEQDLKIYKKNGMEFIPYEYSVEGRFYMVVLMEFENNVLLALYNSATAPDEAEANILGNIINSIRFSIKG